jgi:AcrR family transcriptional regulator
MAGVNKKTSSIETAVRLFSLQGYEATTTLQIAREAGINEPAVFYHFKNINKLFAEIVKDASAPYINRIDAADRYALWLIHQQIVALDALDGVEAATVAFCKTVLTTKAATAKGGP